MQLSFLAYNNDIESAPFYMISFIMTQKKKKNIHSFSLYGQERHSKTLSEKRKKEHDDIQAIVELMAPVQLESRGILLIKCKQWSHKLTPEAFPTSGASPLPM
ncbi:LOW QUALITY PROTEIN: hypothetical protein TorRG33x02_058360 [Trema orientale]|uniref:Uncharacterized protein n=1 Tax=Trema orientale TaxID=63057 RepID=A0A2P5FKE8_TREOI|nr:LOW QUALITY PROTEIN: hypothetical protein TorRG33x02_058360 [Trema orientale]